MVTVLVVKGLIVLEVVVVVVVIVSGVLMVLGGQGHYIHLEYRPQISSFRSAQLGSTEFPVLTVGIFIPVSQWPLHHHHHHGGRGPSGSSSSNHWGDISTSGSTSSLIITDHL